MAKAKPKKSKGLLGRAASLLGSIPAVGNVRNAAKKVGKAKKLVKKTVEKATKKTKKVVRSSKKKVKKTLKKAKKKTKKKAKKKRKKLREKVGKVFTKARKLKNNLSPKKRVQKLKKQMKKTVLKAKKGIKKAKSTAKKVSKAVVKDSKKLMKKATLGARAIGEFTKNGFNGKEVASAIVDFIPIVGNVKGAYEATFGKDPITGRKLDKTERAAAGAAVIGGPLVKGGTRGFKLVSGILPGGKKAAEKVSVPKNTDKTGKKNSVSDVADDILVDSYKSLKKNKDIPGQAHHLNQDAAFRDYIPRNDGLCIKLEGNIRKDVGSPHYKAHESLEGFWNVYRKKDELGGTTPKLSDYNKALKDSLENAGLSEEQATKAVSEAMNQQIKAGLLADDFVPRVPGRINLPKSKP